MSWRDLEDQGHLHVRKQCEPGRNIRAAIKGPRLSDFRGVRLP